MLNIEGIKDRVTKATPGPWVISPFEWIGKQRYNIHPRGSAFVIFSVKKMLMLYLLPTPSRTLLTCLQMWSGYRRRTIALQPTAGSIWR